MKNFLLIIGTLLFINISFSQVEKDFKLIPINAEGEIDTVYKFSIIEQKPEYPGGREALVKFLAKNTKYPKKAIKKGVEGKVYVQFVINKKGKVSNVNVLKGSNPLLDKAAIKVIKKMPKWKPAYQRGKLVNVNYVVPISFMLPKENEY